MKRKKKEFELSNNVKFFNLCEQMINTKINTDFINVNIDKLLESSYIHIKKTMSINKKSILKYLTKHNKINNSEEKYFFIKQFNKFTKSIDLLKNKVNKYYLLTNDTNLQIDLLIGLIKDDKCVPFWTENIKKESDKMFLPTKENLKIKKNPKTFTSNTWFKTEHFTIKNKTKIKHNKIEINRVRKFNDTVYDKKTNKVKFKVKSRKIKLYLTTTQKKYLNRLYGIYRYFYNRAIQFINNYDKITFKTSYLINYNDNKSKKEINLKDVKSKFNFMTMRKYIKLNHPTWMNDIVVQSHLIDQAFIEANDNYNKCMDKYKKNNKPFVLKFKTKKNKHQTINIEQNMLNKKTKTLFSGIRENKKSIFCLKMKENITMYNICDSSISCNVRTSEYFLNLNYRDNFKKDKEILKNKGVVSVDPGIKVLMSTYSDENVNLIGIGITSKMNKICKEIDIMNSNIYKKKKDNNKQFKYKSNKRRNLKKAMHRKIKYLDNIKTELHNKSIKYLTSNYGKIIYPNLDTQGMACKFNSKLARSLYNLSNHKFMKKLKNKCEEYDIELVVRPEYYTSKTCTRCGNIKHDLKLTDRTFKCSKCKLEIDRDVNASRNIMLRNNKMCVATSDLVSVSKH